MIDSTYSNQRTVLCVEDHEDTCQMLKVMLGLEACKADIATTLEEGLQKARRFAYDLILLDWHYTDGTGLELCRKIRKFDECTPIVFYSRVADPPHIKQAMDAGAQGYLVKPVGIDELLQKVVRYTGAGDE